MTSSGPPPKLDLQKLQDAYKRATNRQFFLDYDGTLAPIVKKPEDAKPSEGTGSWWWFGSKLHIELLKLLRSLSSDKHNSICILNSGLFCFSSILCMIGLRCVVVWVFGDFIDIISGRDRKCLQEWVGNLPIGLSAEHGAFLRPNHSSILYFVYLYVTATLWLSKNLTSGGIL